MLRDPLIFGAGLAGTIEALPSVFHFCNFLGSEQVSADLAAKPSMLNARLDDLHDSIIANFATVAKIRRGIETSSPDSLEVKQRYFECIVQQHQPFPL
jgi:hypothetical protein